MIHENHCKLPIAHLLFATTDTHAIPKPVLTRKGIDNALNPADVLAIETTGYAQKEPLVEHSCLDTSQESLTHRHDEDAFFLFPLSAQVTDESSNDLTTLRSIWNKPEVLGGMVYLPAGLLNGQIEFRPTVELWSAGRPAWMMQASTIIESFSDNGTVERIQELLENLDQRD